MTADYVVDGRHVYEVRECVQSLVDRVVEMVEPEAQPADISLDDDLPELVDKVCLRDLCCLYV